MRLWNMCRIPILLYDRWWNGPQVLTRNRKPIEYQYKLHEQILSPVKDAKYLGVDIFHD